VLDQRGLRDRPSHLVKSAPGGGLREGEGKPENGAGDPARARGVSERRLRYILSMMATRVRPVEDYCPRGCARDL
jgi:hypothetical protein